MSLASERFTVGALGFSGRRRVLSDRVNAAHCGNLARVLRFRSQFAIASETFELARCRPETSSDLRSRLQHFLVNFEVLLRDDARLKFLKSLISRRHGHLFRKVDIIQ